MRPTRQKVAARALLFLFAAAAAPVLAAETERIDAASCSIAAGANVSGNSLNCNFGLTPEQLQKVIDAAITGATKPLIAQIVKISKSLGVSEEATKNLLKILGRDPNIADDRLAEALSRIASDYRHLEAQAEMAAALTLNNPTAQKLILEANAAIGDGHFEQARGLLHQATEEQLASAKQAEMLISEAKGAEVAQMLGAASSTATEGTLAMTERRYADAADLFGQASRYVPAEHAAERLVYIDQQVDALDRQGDERGDNTALREAIKIERVLLKERPREQLPLEWARTQGNLGNALEWLGDREKGTADLDAAVEAYRAALTELTQKHAPLEWATTQNNLGNALVRLSERVTGATYLQQAAASYRAALQERTRDRVPLDWAQTESNLASALAELAEQEGGTTDLKTAIEVFRVVSEGFSRTQMPLAWAKVQNNLGVALTDLGEQGTGTADFEQAVVALRSALEERKRSLVPFYWATTQNNLGLALIDLGKRENKRADFEAAVAAFRSALEEQNRDGAAWENTRQNLDDALAQMRRRTLQE